MSSPWYATMTRKTAIIIFGLVLPAVVVASILIPKALRPPSDAFRWTPEKAGQVFPEIKPGSPIVIPFEFRVGKDATRVAFEIRNQGMRSMGISIADEIVEVNAGKAASEVIFALREGTPSRLYDIEIIARDVPTGRIIGKGTIPFAVYPYFFNLGKCSC
jgi:hypothetical protein